MGIECRDRPENGPQGVPWLTQIRGKQQLLKTNKMIAVSTTGFVSEAIKVAEEFGIDLLTINDADEIDLANWFYTIDFFWQEQTYEVSGVINISTEPKNVTGMRSFKLDTPFLKLESINQLTTLEEFIKQDLDDLFAQLPIAGIGIIEKDASIQKEGRFSAELVGEKFIITKLIIPVKLSKEVVGGGLLLSVCRNVNQNEVVAMTGIGLIETRKRKFKVLAIAKKSMSNTDLQDLQMNFLTESDEPYVMAAGTEITVYGKKET